MSTLLKYTFRGQNHPFCAKVLMSTVPVKARCVASKNLSTLSCIMDCGLLRTYFKFCSYFSGHPYRQDSF